MSVAGAPRAYRLDDRAGWRRGPRDDRVAGGSVLRLRDVPGSGVAMADETGSFGGLSDATGMTIAGDGTVFVLDGRLPAVFRYEPCGPSWDQVPCVAGHGHGPREVDDPHGMVATPWGDIVIADSGNRRLQIFGRSGWTLRDVVGPFVHDPQVPGQLRAPRADERTTGAGWWEPWDVAVTRDRRLVVSDAANGLVVLLDRTGRPLSAWDGSGAGVAPLVRPTHLAVDAHGRIYVVQDGVEAVRVLGPAGDPIEHLERDIEAQHRFRPGAVTTDGAGNVVVVDRGAETLVVFGRPEGRSRWRPQVSCQPCGADAIAAGPDGSVILGTGPRVERLDLTARVEPLGTFTTTALDSRVHRCRWHRVVIDAAVPADTFLGVRTTTAEAPLTDAEIAALPEDRWSAAVIHDDRSAAQWDCLVLSPPGRFLWLQLTLEGPGTDTPEIRAVTVSYPRRSSTAYLPAIFRAAGDGDDFVERFLAIFDRTFSDLEEEVDTLRRYFDPWSAPAGGEREPDVLGWLASWLGLSLERHWPVARRRRLVAESSWLFAHRGTPAGLRRHLEIYLGYEPRLLEHHRLRRWLTTGFARLGEASQLWGAAIVDRLQLDENADLGGVRLVDTHDPLRDPFWTHAHRFTVFVPGLHDDPIRRHAVERIVELAKPAHTHADIRFVDPRFRVGDALIGMDTVVGAYPTDTVEGRSRLAYDSVLGRDPGRAAPPTLEVGARRVGADTVID